MLSETVHIVCLDAPAPADYGGAIDMYYKITALATAGKKVILHYFNYNKERGHEGLELYCAEINVYKRRSFISALPLSSPYIVRSRISSGLIERLNKDDHPVILEGIHCTGILPFLKQDRKIIVRIHNDEAVYYSHLAESESLFPKRLYLQQESRLLKRYQLQLSRNLSLACLSNKDLAHFQDQGFTKVHFIPCFIPWQQLKNKTGRGNYCLYHGNMQINENEAAAIWLIKNIFSELTIPLVIAGKGISTRLEKTAAPHSHIQLEKNPSIQRLDKLIQDAHINVLPSMNETGVKLKLLHALIEGRFCISNFKAAWGSGIEDSVLTVEAITGWITAIAGMMNTDFTEAYRNERQKVLAVYNNRENAEKINEVW